MKKLAAIIISLSCILSITPKVFATEQNFADVPQWHTYYEDIEALSNQGILLGSGDGNFYPDRVLAANELSALLSRAFQYEDAEDDRAPDAPVTRGRLYHAAFLAAEVKTFDPGLWEGKNWAGPYETAMLAAKGFGLCNADSTQYELVSRGEAAYVVHQLIKTQFEQEAPPIYETVDFQYEPGCLWMMNGALKEAARIPENILRRFQADGWTLVVGPQELREYNDEHDRHADGYILYARKRIVVSNPAVIPHEFGHFFLNIEMQKTVNACFAKESGAASEVISRYSATSAHEFFSEYFCYYLRYHDNERKMKELQEKTPSMFDFMRRLEEDEWTWQK